MKYNKATSEFHQNSIKFRVTFFMFDAFFHTNNWLYRPTLILPMDKNSPNFTDMFGPMPDLLNSKDMSIFLLGGTISV